MAQDPARPPSVRGSASVKKKLEPNVTLHYLDKAHDAFTANRTYANRVLVLQTVIALVVVGVVIGAAEGEEFTLGSSKFSLDVWAVLIAGGVFVALTPGFVIGRLIYNADLAKEMQALYARLESGLAEHPDDTVVKWKTMSPWEIAPLLTEAGWAFARLVPSLRQWVGGGIYLSSELRNAWSSVGAMPANWIRSAGARRRETFAQVSSPTAGRGGLERSHPYMRRPNRSNVDTSGKPALLMGGAPRHRHN